MSNSEQTNQPTIELSMTGAEAGEHLLRADAAANRELIISTAQTLFAERGVAEVTMADIAEAAGVGKGTLYRRFANKAELSLALMDTQMTEFQERSMSQMRVWTVEAVPYLHQLGQFLESLVEFTDAHSPLLCEVESSGLLQEESTQSVPYFWQFLTVRGLLRSAVREGELASDLDIDYMADVLLAPLHVELFRYQRRVKGYSLERITAGLVSLLEALSRSRQ